jgi:NAD(P)-dependent dehydrogenase (short-subunit alcohol dehydrogenase family)
VNVNAGMYVSGRVDLARTPYGHDFGRISTYAASKVCSVLAMRVLAEELVGTGVTVNAVHPGVVRTALGDMPGPAGLLLKLVKRAWSTPEQGAEAPVWLATATELAGTNGQYIDRRQPVPFAKPAQDLELAHPLYDWSARYVDGKTATS